jgi:hypothetical protein
MLTGNRLDNLRATQYDTDTMRTEAGNGSWPVPTNFTNRKRPTLPPIPPVGGGDSRGKEMGSEACDLVVANLSAYQDDELDPDQERVIEAHLHKCDYCSSVFAAIQTTDMLVEREWRDGSPLPSSLEINVAVDAIMDALPPVPAPTPRFEPKRVHARTRWMRFATGITGIFGLSGMLLSSYALGFAHGRRSLNAQGMSPFSLALPTSSILSTAANDIDTPPLLCLPRSLTQSPLRQTVRR